MVTRSIVLTLPNAGVTNPRAIIPLVEEEQQPDLYDAVVTSPKSIGFDVVAIVT